MKLNGWCRVYIPHIHTTVEVFEVLDYVFSILEDFLFSAGHLIGYDKINGPLMNTSVRTIVRKVEDWKVLSLVVSGAES
jgi:hypothetical protein